MANPDKLARTGRRKKNKSATQYSMATMRKQTHIPQTIGEI